MIPAEHNLLSELSRALNDAPFAATVSVLVPREAARALERLLLLHQRVADRREAPQP